jgi:hypothetical protein
MESTRETQSIKKMKAEYKIALHTYKLYLGIESWLVLSAPLFRLIQRVRNPLITRWLPHFLHVTVTSAAVAQQVC